MDKIFFNFGGATACRRTPTEICNIYKQTTYQIENNDRLYIQKIKDTEN